MTLLVGCGTFRIIILKKNRRLKLLFNGTTLLKMKHYLMISVFAYYLMGITISYSINFLYRFESLTYPFVNDDHSQRRSFHNDHDTDIALPLMTIVTYCIPTTATNDHPLVKTVCNDHQLVTTIATLATIFTYKDYSLRPSRGASIYH